MQSSKICLLYVTVNFTLCFPATLYSELCVCVFQGDTLEMVGETVSGMARCPYDPKHANVALFAGEEKTLSLLEIPHSEAGSHHHVNNGSG